VEAPTGVAGPVKPLPISRTRPTPVVPPASRGGLVRTRGAKLRQGPRLTSVAGNRAARSQLGHPGQRSLPGIDSPAVSQDRHIIGGRRRGMTHRLRQFLGSHHGLGDHGSRTPPGGDGGSSPRHDGNLTVTAGPPHPVAPPPDPTSSPEAAGRARSSRFTHSHRVPATPSGSALRPPGRPVRPLVPPGRPEDTTAASGRRCRPDASGIGLPTSRVGGPGRAKVRR
jgi:hypothetical protein